MCDKFSAAIVSRTLEGRFPMRSGNPSKPLPGDSIFTWVLQMADLIYPTARFIGIEMTKTSFNKRCECAILECKKWCIGAIRWAFGMP